ncbi:hypothetical protein [Acidisoma sp. 7E03]
MTVARPAKRPRKPATGALKAIPTIIEAMEDPAIFGPHFRGKTWGPWKAFLRSMFGLPMFAEEAALYRRLTGRTEAPVGQFEEATLIVGRRGGKSRILALIAVYLAAFRNYEPFLSPGEVATVAVLASDRRQAQSILRYSVALLKETPLLASLIQDETQEQIVLGNRVTLEIGTASFRSIRGRTFAAVLADELAFWRVEEGSANPDVEILRAIRPGLGTIPGAPLLLASSPYARKGELYQSFRRDWGNDASSVLCWKAATLDMHDNARLRKMRDQDFEKDPQSARAEWDGEFRDDLADFLTPEMIEAVTCQGRTELPPVPGVRYVAFCDPSGGVSDAMTLAVAHLEADKAVLDAVLVVQPPFDPSEAVARCAALLKRYSIVRVRSDRYAGQWVVSSFAAVGITVDHSERPKSDLYLDFLPMVTAKSAELLDNRQLLTELANLERRTARSGRDSVDHGPGQHDDLANSVAGVLSTVMHDRRTPMIDRNNLKPAEEKGEAVDATKFPHTECLYATVWVDHNGICGWTTFAYAEGMQPGLLILDFGREPWRPTIMDQIVASLVEIRARIIALGGYAHERGISLLIHCQDQLCATTKAALARHPMEVKPYHRLATIGALPIEQTWLRDPVRLMISASGQAAEGKVQLSKQALERAVRIPIEGLLEVFPGQDLDDDALRLAMLVGIAFNDPNSNAFTAPDLPTTMMRFG